MKRLSIILACVLVALSACTKSKEVHPEIGDGNDEIVTVGMKDVHVEYVRNDIAELHKVVFHYSLAEAQQFQAVEMSKREAFFELTLDNLLKDTLYCYYYELFPNGGNAFLSEQKTFHTQAFDAPEPPEPLVAELPTVVTSEVSEITTNSAVCGGEVTDDGGGEVTERGICWGTNVNPSLSDNHIAVGSGLGSFTALIESLEANATYHVRAYATNEKGTAYGLDREFATLVYVPEGAINGLFTINDQGDQVFFSQGNLQYNKTTAIWSFMEHQYDMVETEGQDVGTDYANQDIVSLFGWGTSGWDNGNIYYQPYNTESIDDNSIGYGYGPTDGTSFSYDMVDDYASSDWGVYNAIFNGGNVSNIWRTLTAVEWNYLFHFRTTSSGICFAKGVVNGVNGIILLPDNWNVSFYSLNNTNNPYVLFSSNEIALSDWGTMEANGAVFLPAAGYRFGTSVYAVGSHGIYYSVSHYFSYHAFGVWFSDTYPYLNTENNTYRSNGRCVRLVQDANK